jgi:hypothetical protein
VAPWGPDALQATHMSPLGAASSMMIHIGSGAPVGRLRCMLVERLAAQRLGQRRPHLAGRGIRGHRLYLLA